jgi:hypothetical protein
MLEQPGVVPTSERWPSLPLDGWRDTYETLHMWTQIVGKIRMVQTPLVNHWWNVTLYLTARGLTTSPIPYDRRTFQIDFDFVSHELVITTSAGARRTLALAPRSVAAFFHEVMAALGDCGIVVKIGTKPLEVSDPIPFDKDDKHAAYDPEYANRCWRILSASDGVLKDFRRRYLGKVSPVHFFWGGFDLAVTRFSGREAPPHPGNAVLPDWVNREAYSHEVSSCGFWPGSGPIQYPAYYAYAYPEPEGFSDAPVLPQSASYSADMHLFILPYDEVRQAENSEAMLLEFLQTTYEAAADRGGWDRGSLERNTVALPAT